MRGIRSRWTIVGGVAVVTLLLDQLTKWWAVNALAEDRSIPIVWTLRLALYHNTGAAFSMGRDSDWVRFLPLLVLIAVGIIGWRSRSVLSKTGAVAVGLIIGGALGNIIDRAMRSDGLGFFAGGVVDFIDLQWWPVFNVADMGVVIGGLLFALVTAGATPSSPEEDPDADAGSGGEQITGATGGSDGPAGSGAGEPVQRLADVDATP